jgi:H+/gluconate symporter-like permease
MCAFLISVAIAQVISLFNWSGLILAIAATIIYLVGQKEKSIQLQVISIGLILGWAKCYFVG